MKADSIILIPFEHFDNAALETASGIIVREFGRDVRIRAGNIDLSEYYDPVRRQYNATPLLKKIDSEYSSPGEKMIGIVNVDLFIPILTYIFGQAFLNGNSGIVSAFRLGNDKYGINGDEMLKQARLNKEIVHELGHLFGLIHCSDPVCVMRSSTYVEDIDQKADSFCIRCSSTLKSESL